MTKPDASGADLRVEGGLDHRQVFAAVPTPCLVLGRDLRMVDANGAYLQLASRRLEDLVGRSIPEAFPDDPAGSRTLTSSLRRVLGSGEPHRLPLVRYDLEAELGTGVRRTGWWSALSLPVLDAAGTVTAVLLVVEDVSDVVRFREEARHEQAVTHDLRLRTEALEADLRTYASELTALAAAEATSSRQLAGLAEAALALAGAESLEELTETVFRRGLTALGATGGGVAVRGDGDVLHLTATASLGADAQRTYRDLTLSGPFPGSVAARTGRTVLLPDPETGLTFHPGMADVYLDPGQVAWAALPLRVGPRVLGSLVVGWDVPQEFTPRDVELLAAFAAQCALTLDRLLVRLAEREVAVTTARWSEALQRSLLTDPPALRGCDVRVRYQPAAQEAQVGGDWYDAFATVAGVTTVVIGDVAGHDRDAAVGMGQVRGVLRGVAQALDGSPASVLTTLDRALEALSGTGEPAPVTAILGQVHDGVTPSDPQVLRWSNAGHPPPLLVHPDGTLELLERAPDLLLGVDPATPRTEHQVDLPVGATVVLYTDGLVERRGQSLEEGLARLVENAAGLQRLTADAVCDSLLRRLGADAEDDVALLVVRSLAVPPSLPLVLAARPESVRTARDAVRAHCEAAGVPEDTTDSALLLTSETVTNALAHGRSETRLDVVVDSHRLRVEVHDGNSRHPQRLPHDPESLNGRGVELIDLLASTWGVRTEPDGKTVWFELATG